MTKLTAVEIERIVDEMINLSRKMNNDIVTDLEFSCNNLRNLFQDVRFGCNECAKIHNFNLKARELQNDTFGMCNEVKDFITNAEDISNE